MLNDFEKKFDPQFSGDLTQPHIEVIFAADNVWPNRKNSKSPKNLLKIVKFNNLNARYKVDAEC